MQVIRLAHETDFEGWRAGARRLRAANVPPEAAIWTVDGQARLLELAEAPAREPRSETAASFTVPKGFLELADEVILHRSDERFALLYRLLWRLQSQPNLLRITT